METQKVGVEKRQRSVLPVEIPDDFVRVMKGAQGAGQLPAQLMVQKLSWDRASSPLICIKFRSDLLKEMRWQHGDHISVAVSVITRRAILQLTNSPADFTLQGGGHPTANEAGYIRLAVRDEATRALMPCNDKKEYCPRFETHGRGDAILFDLDRD